MTINGILETALYVRDPAASAAFYQGLFGFKTLLESERLIALDVAGSNVLLLFHEGATGESFDTGNGIIPPHFGVSPAHFAFSIPADEFDEWLTRLKSAGITIESTVNWPGGARSMYFYDPDRNLAELITPGFWKL